MTNRIKFRDYLMEIMRNHDTSNIRLVLNIARDNYELFVDRHRLTVRTCQLGSIYKEMPFTKSVAWGSFSISNLVLRGVRVVPRKGVVGKSIVVLQTS